MGHQGRLYGRGILGVAEIEGCELHSHSQASPPARRNVHQRAGRQPQRKGVIGVDHWKGDGRGEDELWLAFRASVCGEVLLAAAV